MSTAAILTSFRAIRPKFQIGGNRQHTWLAAVASEVEDVREHVEAGGVVYELPGDPVNAGAGTRTRLAGDVLDRYFASCYAADEPAPDELIHVTCGGTVTPSGAQRLVQSRQWPTHVTHVYRQGGHAAVSTIELASRLLGSARRVDVAHTELGSLACDGRGDAMIRYSIVREPRMSGLQLRGVHHQSLQGVVDAITEPPSPIRGVPESIAYALRAFVRELFKTAAVDIGRLRDAVFAVHPSDPWVLDRVIDVLMLRDDQMTATRTVVRDDGDLLSATLPHIWMRILDDRAIAAGTLIPSLAFGPGPTLFGALLEKR